MTTDVQDQPQTSFEEQAVIDRELESAITFYQESKAGIDSAKEDFRNAEKMLQGDIGKREMMAGKYRVGRWILTVTEVAAHQRITVKEVKAKASRKK